MNNKKLEEWEQAHINSLTLKMLFYATIGTAVAAGIAYILEQSDIQQINPELIFIPWGIALVIGISSGFHRGVLAERERAKSAEKIAAANAKPAAKKKTKPKAKTAAKTASKAKAKPKAKTAPKAKAKAKPKAKAKK